MNRIESNLWKKKEKKNFSRKKHGHKIQDTIFEKLGHDKVVLRCILSCVLGKAIMVVVDLGLCGGMLWWSRVVLHWGGKWSNQVHQMWLSKINMNIFVHLGITGKNSNQDLPNGWQNLANDLKAHFQHIIRRSLKEQTLLLILYVCHILQFRSLSFKSIKQIP